MKYEFNKKVYEVEVFEDLKEANNYMKTHDYGVLCGLGNKIVLAKIEKHHKPAPHN